jgi:ubiquinone/menaquinone biosynthesis C-methylase UbiE
MTGGINSNNEWLRETRFGRWFLSTDIWVRYVLLEAIQDFASLLEGADFKKDKILDAGCGQGLAFSLLEKQFSPKSILGIDLDAELLLLADAAAANCSCDASVAHVPASDMGIESDSIDLIFCHQLLHHTANQEGALSEFMRVLAPGGVLLVSESCENFIGSFIVKWFFRHPDMVQKNAQGYVALVREAGFIVEERRVGTSVPWWSRPDLGLFEKLGLFKNNMAATEVLIVARKA